MVQVGHCKQNMEDTGLNVEWVCEGKGLFSGMVVPVRYLQSPVALPRAGNP